MAYYIYMMTNKYNNVIYTGVTNDLIRRVYEHKNHLIKDSFTARYNISKLVFFEEIENIQTAIEREKQIKSWNRKRKEELIQSQNPTWIDQYPMIL